MSDASKPPGKPPGSGPKPAAQGSSWAALRRFWPYLRPHRRWMWIGLVMIPVVAGVSALRPLLVKQAIDSGAAASIAEAQALFQGFKLSLVFICLVGP